MLDVLSERSPGANGDRVVILPVEATLPRAEPKPAGVAEPAAAKDAAPERIGREELYEDIKNAARCSRVYLVMVALSTIVAAVGLYYDSVAIIIGAMVIAPLLGPNMALALGTTLGDLSLLRRALLTALAGIALAMVLSTLVGMAVGVDPATPEVASRNGVGHCDTLQAPWNPTIRCFDQSAAAEGPSAARRDASPGSIAAATPGGTEQ